MGTDMNTEANKRIATADKPDAGNKIDFLFLIEQVKLTDGSHVYNVRLNNSDVVFAAVSEAAAQLLADDLVAAINRYTCNTAELQHDY